MSLRLEQVPDPPAAAAQRLAEQVAAAVEARGTATLALSGGSTAPALLAALARADVPWRAVDVFQVDERVEPAGSPERNLTAIVDALGALAPGRIHPLPVDRGDVDLSAAAALAAADLVARAGDPPLLDVVHLGVGDDGHTASLAPDDPLSSAAGPDVPPVAAVHAFRGFDRLTLTLPVLARARAVVWLVTGRDKAFVIPALRAADPATPAGRVAAARVAAGDPLDVLVCDAAAVGAPGGRQG